VLGEGRILELLESLLKKSPAEQTEIVVFGQHSHLTRYSDNYIHQNVGERNYGVSVRAVTGKRIGLASSNQLEEKSLMETIVKATDLSRLAPENPHFVSLPEPQPVPEWPKILWPETRDCPADLRAAYVDRVINMTKEKGLKAAGAMSTSLLELAVANSLGVRAYAAMSRASLSALVTGRDSSGFWQNASMNLADIEPTRVAERAISKCLLSRNPVSIEPGEYDVILEPKAVADMVLFLAYMGFSAASYQQGQSFMSSMLDKKVTGENITIWDDGLDPAGQPMPFDFEGVPKQKVMLIENGIAKGVVYDSLSAAREGKRSTGHALPPGSFVSSLPINLMVAPGESTIDEMIRSTDKGILVTRFHYVNPVHPLKTIITGMTRDGTFLIENGKITKGLRNLRFTQSILEAFDRVEAVSSERSVEGELVSVVCPAMKIRRFTFTGITEF